MHAYFLSSCQLQRTYPHHSIKHNYYATNRGRSPMRDCEYSNIDKQIRSNSVRSIGQWRSGSYRITDRFIPRPYTADRSNWSVLLMANWPSIPVVLANTGRIYVLAPTAKTANTANFVTAWSRWIVRFGNRSRTCYYGGQWWSASAQIYRCADRPMPITDRYTTNWPVGVPTPELIGQPTNLRDWPIPCFRWKLFDFSSSSRRLGISASCIAVVSLVCWFCCLVACHCTYLISGNIMVRGPPLMHGYERNPAANSEAFNAEGTVPSRPPLSPPAASPLPSPLLPFLPSPLPPLLPLLSPFRSPLPPVHSFAVPVSGRGVSQAS